MKNIIKITILLTIVSITFFSSCIDYKFEEPDIYDCNLDFQPNTSIAELLALHPGSGYQDSVLLIEDDIIIKGTVIANDKSGNYYKSFVIQDSTEAGVQTGLLISINEYESHNKYHEGDMIYIKCKGLYLGYYGEVIQLGVLYNGAIGRIGEPSIKYHIFNACNGKSIKPKSVTLNSLNSAPINTLIKLEDVQFKISELGETYADAGENVTSNQLITDCGGTAEISVRTSGYARFASEILPSGKGSLIAINGKHNGHTQLIIRNVNEVNLEGERCGAVYQKDFDEVTFSDPGGSTIENLTNGNWTTYKVIGETNWKKTNQGHSSYYASVTNYNFDTSSNSDAEVWLISPSFNLSLLNNPVLNFKTAKNYSGPNLEIKISTDYSGSGEPANATWTNLSATLSGGTFVWMESGDIDLSSFKETSVYISYVYKGTDSEGATWEVDDISIFDN